MNKATEDYELTDGLLTVHREVLHDQDLLFDEVCRQLLESEQDEIVIDLSQANYINSTYVGIIAATFFQANTRKKRLRLRASRSLTEVLRLAGFEEFIPIDEVD